MAGLAEISALVSTAFGACSGLRFVGEGELALRTRFNKAVVKDGRYVVVGPGLHMMLPGVHKLAKISTQLRTLTVPVQAVLLTDSTTFAVGAVIKCRVIPRTQELYKALYSNECPLNDAVIRSGATIIEQVISTKNSESLTKDRSSINDELRQLLVIQADAWGLAIEEFELFDPRPTALTARIIQTEAQMYANLAVLEAVATKLGTDVSKLDPSTVAAVVGNPVLAMPAG